MANKARFAQFTRNNPVIVTGVDDLTSAPVNTVLLATASSDVGGGSGLQGGAIFIGLTAIPRATVTGSSLHLFLSKDGGGTKILIDSAEMGAHTVASDTVIPVTTFTKYSIDNTLNLDADDELYVGSAVALAGGIAFMGQWSDFDV